MCTEMEKERQQMDCALFKYTWWFATKRFPGQHIDTMMGLMAFVAISWRVWLSSLARNGIVDVVLHLAVDHNLDAYVSHPFAVLAGAAIRAAA